jgi:hypothetical protein
MGFYVNVHFKTHEGGNPVSVDLSCKDKEQASKIVTDIHEASEKKILVQTETGPALIRCGDVLFARVVEYTSYS